MPVKSTKLTELRHTRSVGSRHKLALSCTSLSPQYLLVRRERTRHPLLKCATCHSKWRLMTVITPGLVLRPGRRALHCGGSAASRNPPRKKRDFILYIPVKCIRLEGKETNKHKKKNSKSERISHKKENKETCDQKGSDIHAGIYMLSSSSFTRAVITFFKITITIITKLTSIS